MTTEFKQWFEEYLDTWYAFAKERIEQHGSVPPTITVVKKGGLGLALMSCDMSTEKERHRTMQAHRALASATDMVAGAVLTVEAYMLAVSDKKEAARIYEEGVSLAEKKDSIEVVLWTARRGDLTLIAYAQIIEAGSKTLGALVITDPTGMVSRYA